MISGPLELVPGHEDMVTNPTLLVEVLSDSTERYNRGTSFDHFRTLPSFAEYVLVSQKEPAVDVFFRQADGAWLLSPVRGRDAVAPLQSLGIGLRLAEVYDRIEFPEIAPFQPHGN